MVGVGVGTAAADALAPIVEPGKQQAWSNHPNRILDPSLVARLVAQGGMELGAAQDDAKREGFSPDRLNDLVYLAQTVPGFAEALAAWRRDQLTPELFRHTLVKNGMDERYYSAVENLKDERMSLPVVALAIVRGLMAAPFPLPFTPPAGVGKVPAFPQSTLDPLEQVKAFGYDRDDLFLQTAVTGRPMGPEAAAGAFFRGILEDDDYLRAVLEGDVRGEWAEAIREQARQIPSASLFVNWRLRGWTDDAGMHAGTARHGMSPADTKVLFETAGRPLSWHQTFIGLERGGTYNGSTADIHPAFLKALQESDIRPEWYALAWAQRFSYPSAFVLRALTEAGDLTQAEADEILRFIGWPPELATKVSTRWAAATLGAKANPYIGKAETQLWTETHKLYVKEAIDATTADNTLTILIPDATDRARVLQLWEVERGLAHPALPPA